MTDKKLTSAASRRKFLKGAAVAGVATIAMPQISRAQTVTLKMQGSWGAGDIFNDYANAICQHRQLDGRRTLSRSTISTPAPS